jgi:hypothetical protein
MSVMTLPTSTMWSGRQDGPVCTLFFYCIKNMVYNFNDLARSVSNKLNNEQLTAALGNPLALALIIIAIFIFLFFLAFHKSMYKNKWQIFSILTLAGIAAIVSTVFISEAYRKKSINKLIGAAEIKKSYEMPPNVFFEMSRSGQNTAPIGPATSRDPFDELFSNT